MQEAKSDFPQADVTTYAGEQQERRDLIRDIESHYPADTHERGPELLSQAICHEWRSMPTPILRRYAQLCLAEERYR
jgi:hypothetical protein